MSTSAVSTDTDVITSEIFIAAPPERIFQALTARAQVPQWGGQSGMYRTTFWEGEVRPGGKWWQKGDNAAGEPFEVTGEYSVVELPRRLSHTWQATWTGDLTTRVDWMLEPATEGDRTGTLVRLRHSRFAGSGAAEAHDQGWKRVFAWMRDYVERGETMAKRT